VSATVDVRVRENGSGVVRVLVEADDEAVRAAESGGLPLEQAVRLDDLDDADWNVGEWVRAEDGSATIELSKPFEDADQVAGILEEASGEDGPLDLRAGREVGFRATEYSLAGKVDLENVTTGVPTDPELLANLTAQSVDPNVIDQQLLAQLKGSFALRVVADLPGERPETIAAEPGAVTTVRASSSVQDSKRLIFLVAALLLVVLAIFLWIRGGRPRPRKKKPRPKPGPRNGPPRKRVPRPHVPHPHLPEHMPRPRMPQNVPRPHIPHPHLPGKSRPDAPPPPPRKPIIPPGMT
jgi:hypothetical protein